MTTYYDTPDWISEEGITTLRKGYLLKDETPNQMYKRLAQGGVKQLKNSGKVESIFVDGIEEDLYTILSNGWFSPASPVASNFNVPEDYRDEVNGELLSRGLPVSCFGSAPENSIDGIFQTNHEIAMMSKMGGGTSVSLDNLIGISPVTHWAKVYDTTTDVVSQGACYSDDTEILTDRGFVLFSELNSQDKVAQVNKETNELEYVKPIEIVIENTPKEMIHFYTKSMNMDLLVTPNHKMVTYRNGEYVLTAAKDIKTFIREAKTIQSLPLKGNNHLTDWDRILIAYQADGSTNKSGNSKDSNIYAFHFSKKRKIERLEYLLNLENVRYSKTYGKDGTCGFRVWFPDNSELSKSFDWILNRDISGVWAKEFIEEICLWDGSKKGNHRRYVNTNKLACNRVQWVATCAGYRNNLKFTDRPFPRKTIGRLNIVTSTNTLNGDSIKRKSVQGYKGKVYCVEVPSNIIVVRRNGQVTVCGNTRRGSVAQYVSIEHRDIDLILDAIDKTRGDQTQKLKCNLGVTISDNFMNKLLSGDKESGRLFAKVLKLRLQTGSPYIVFIDTANRVRPDDYKRLGMMILASNLCCLSGSTKVLTKEFGGVEIKDLIGKTVTIFDGQNWVKNSNWYKTEDKLKSYRVTLASGSYVDCTYNHLHWVYKDYLNIGLKDCVSLKTEDLKVGQWIVHCDKLVSDYDKIISIVPIEDDYGYCTTVPTTGSFELANKVLTHNSEIFQPSDPLHSFTCVLSSLNIDKYDEWEHWYGQKSGFTVIELATIFLDGVCQEFIDKAKSISGFENAVRSAEKGRALGLGLMGLHSYYQSKMWTFDSEQALEANILISSKMKKEAESSSKWLAQKLGAPEWTKGGSNHRNIVKLAIAPTLTNSVICNAGSAGVDPIHSNYYVYSGAKGTFVRKNKHLVKVLEQLGMNKDSTWQNIQQNNGSVQELNLPQKIKDIFKTAHEIDQSYVIQQAADRQPNIDQGQSVNLYILHDEKAPVIAKLHIQAWKKGLKSLYYIRSNNKLNNQRPVTLKEEKPQWVINYREDCPWCHKAKSLLNYFGFNPTMVIQETGRVPQIYKNGELIGGYTELFELYKSILESPNQVHNGMAYNDVQGHLGGLSTMSDPDCEACQG